MKHLKIILMLLILVGTCNVTLIAQESDSLKSANTETRRVQIIDPGMVTNLTDFHSIWEITKLAGGLRWVIILVMVVGLSSLLYKYAELFVDGKHSTDINHLNLSSASLSEIEKIVVDHPNSWVHQMFNNMLKIFRTTERAEDFHHEITNFVQLQQDKFATFQGKMAFLSDTAGALGLLGTVWGMFVTFSKGILDNQVILTGMGIALVTTLMGLVVSIVLNFFSTQIQGYFRKKIDALLSKGEELRLQLLKLQQQHYLEKYFFEGKNDALVQRQPILKSEKNLDNSDENKINNSKYRIVTISGDNQIGQVNSRLKQPLMVQVKNGDGSVVKGQEVIFNVENGNGYLENGNKIKELITDNSGIAKSNFILGKVVGKNVVKVSLKHGNGEYTMFNAVGNPASPSQLKYISGNLQNSPAGQKLKEPFIVKLIDSYNNPISDHPVIFKVKVGAGHFSDNKKNYISKTDHNGNAQANFTLPLEPGFNSVCVYAKGLKRSKIEFEALGQ